MAWEDANGIWWEDLRFPAQGINPPGAASDPGVDDDTGLLVFSGTLDNVIAGIAEMPHNWKPGTVIRPHLHIRFPNSAAGNERWSFGYDRANINGDFANASGTYTAHATITIANPTNVNRHVIASFGDLAMVGYRTSCAILWKISRLAFSDAADNDGVDSLLLMFDIHYQLNRRGTRGEYA